MLSSTKSPSEPLYPPYPEPGALTGWRGRLFMAIWLATIVLLCLRINLGALLLIPIIAWFARMVWRTGRWRMRALDGLEEHAPAMTKEEREQALADIYRMYGGEPYARVKRRVEAIRAIPPRSEC